MTVIVRLKGGVGSGHYGHRGRPGHQGGSLPRNVLALAETEDTSNFSYALNKYNTIRKSIEPEFSKFLQDKGMTKEMAEHVTSYMSAMSDMPANETYDRFMSQYSKYAPDITSEEIGSYITRFKEADLQYRRNILEWQDENTLMTDGGTTIDMARVSDEWLEEHGIDESSYDTGVMGNEKRTDKFPLMENPEHILYDEYKINTAPFVNSAVWETHKTKFLSDIVTLARNDKRIDAILRSGALRTITYNNDGRSALATAGARSINIHRDYGANIPVFIHELGHILDDAEYYYSQVPSQEVINERNRKERKVFNSGVRPSSYGFTNTMEDYAESFVNWIVGTNTDTLASRLQFIEEDYELLLNNKLKKEPWEL